LLKDAKTNRDTGSRGFPDDLGSPGLTPGHEEIHTLVREVRDRTAAFHYLSRQPCLWVVFLGGTGTGKSTLFNALCGSELSRTGVERPNTQGPVAWAHVSCPLERDFPFSRAAPTRRPTPPGHASAETGEPGNLVILDHEQEDLAHLVIVDTPDLDSVDEENRLIAEKLALLADAVVFVASQEKYADEVPSLVLHRILRDETPVYFLLNKADEGFRTVDATTAHEAQGIPLEQDRIWIIAYTASAPSGLAGQKGFRDFRERLLEDLSRHRFSLRRGARLQAGATGLKKRLDRLTKMLELEDRACEDWMERLQGLFRETADHLIQAESEHFSSRNRERIQREIRRLFSRYDLLASPRRAVQRVLSAPFRLLGFDLRGRRTGRKDARDGLRPSENLAPILAAVDRMNRRALETLSPADETAPLFAALREPGVALTRDEVETRVIAEQKRLEAWLRDTFDRMSRGLPTVKKWSIYSTSIVWGVLILALEATLGGGFTVIDALLDSALAPFVTKGSAELFASREIRTVIREMAETYRSGIVSILEEQRDRYNATLGRLRASDGAREGITALRRDMTRFLEDPDALGNSSRSSFLESYKRSHPS